MTAISHLKVRGRHRPRPRHLERARATSAGERLVMWLLVLFLLALGIIVGLTLHP